MSFSLNNTYLTNIGKECFVYLTFLFHFLKEKKLKKLRNKNVFILAFFFLK